jgi:NADPH-dependent glutamate synthase beta subunit-like oxidoreductase
MKSFAHHNARSIKEAIKLLAEYEGKARVNAGGTDLLGAMRDNCLSEYPEAVINLKDIENLSYIKKETQGIKIGALTKLSDIERSPEVKETYKLLAEAAHSVASPHIRNMATLGGNLAQDVRCWYYRYPEQIGGPIVCLRKGGKFCSALAGDNRYHSLFGAARLDEYPCGSHCPAHTDIPGYLGHIKKGDFEEAARVLMDYNPIPAVTGRVCPVFCEPECNRSELDDAVAINCIERGIGDYILENAALFYERPGEKSGKAVAVIGSGPAGLAAAYYLRRSGHGVTVYEKLPEAGGMLRYSIPPFRLPKEVVRKQIQALEQMGIIFKVGVNVGKDISLKDLLGRFDAVFVAGGTWKPLLLGVPGEDASGVYYALDYLKKINSGEKVPLGKKVVVIGGGSVAVDAARVALRSGAGEVHLVCLECRDLVSMDRMLALESEITEAEEEGVIIHPSLGVQEIVTKNGKAVGLDTVTCLSVRESDGSFNPQYDRTCTALSLEGDSIIVAIGQAVDPSLSAPGLEYGVKGTLTVVKETGETGMKGVYAGGDIVAGATTVIQAITAAREAVHGIELSFGAVETSAGHVRKAADFADSGFREIPRVRVREAPPSERVKTINVEDIKSLSMSEIGTEAERCFNCGCLAVGPSDLALALVALDARIVTSKRSVPAGIFFNASATRSSILDADELIKEIRIPKPPAGTTQRYEKFTLRKPIDFAVASVAMVMTVHKGVCKDARIVLGAVAPEPLRARAAENFLKGKPLDEAAAGKAGELAMEGALPLRMNAYKLEIAKTLVKRAILG